MNKIQLEAALQLAILDYDANPNQLNEQKLNQARQAWDQFMGTEPLTDEVKVEKQPEKPQKAAIKAEPKQPKAPKAAAVPIKAVQVSGPSDPIGTATAEPAITDQSDVSEGAETVVDEPEKKT